MSHERPSGTPARASGYIRPPDRQRPLWWAIGIAGALLVAFAVLFAAGRRGVASPGRLSAGHSAIDRRCAECHDTPRHGLGQVADLRCVRCHDPDASDRLLQASHVRRGSGVTAAAHAGEAVACATCHTEHRGRADLAHAGDDRTCARCHQFKSLETHPEFAAIRAAAVTGAGLKFTHDRHLIEVQKEGGQRCEACHQPTANGAGFQPIDFDAHCASCHTANGALTGETDPFDGQVLLAASSAGPLITPGARSLVVVSRMPHRDDWVLANLTRLRRAIDPEGERAERVALRAQIAELKPVPPAQPLSAMPLADLQQFGEALERDLADTGSANVSSSGRAADGEDARALEEMTTAIQRVAGTLLPAAAAEVAVAPDLTEPAERIRARFDARKAELLTLLDTIAARGNRDLAARTAPLRARVLALGATESPATGNAGALRDRLTALDTIFQVLRALPDQQAGADAAAVSALRDGARQQIGGGLSVEQFSARRRELLRALDAIGRQAALSGRVAVLRRRVLMLQPSDTPAGQRRARTQAMLDRVRLEIELINGGETTAPSAVVPARDAAARPVLAGLTRRLARLDAVSPAADPSAPSPAAATDALAALAGPCLKCHVMEGARLAPVAAAQRVFRRATFTHKPHLPQADCLSCHRGVTTSKLATDLIVPPLATCQSCHAPSKARSDCAACHTYHPAAPELVAGR